MVLGDGGQVVDVEHLARLAAHGFEAHVFHPLGLQSGAEAALRIVEVHHGGVTGTIGVVVQCRGVLALHGVFGVEAPAAIADVAAHGTGTHVEGQIEQLRRVLGREIAVLLVFAHKAGPEGDAQFAVGHALEDAVEVHFAVDAAHQAVAIAPIAALFAGQCLEGDTVDGTILHIDTQQRVVESKVAVLVGAQDEAVAELLVEVTRRETQFFAVVTDEVVGQALTFVFGVEAEQGVLVGLETQARSEVAVGVENVGAGIEQQFLRHIGGADNAVSVAHLPVNLHVAGYMATHDALGHGGGSG